MLPIITAVAVAQAIEAFGVDALLLKWPNDLVCGRTKIGGMGGSIKLESVVGKGTTMRLKLPLTVAIIHSLMVKVGSDIYAIPITNVIRDLSIKKEEIKYNMNFQIKNKIFDVVKMK